MDIKYLIYGFLMLLGGQATAWFQVYGMIIWPRMKDYSWTVYLISPIIAFFYIYGTKFLVQAFNGEMWPSRIIGFCAGILIFTFATSIFAKEGINLKSGVCIGLCLIILMIQIFWKTN